MKQQHSHLVAGPWIGEFGWEIFAWQGYIRALSRKFDKTTVICNSGTEHFYSDFSEQIINFDTSFGPRDSFYQQGVDITRLSKHVFIENKNKISGKVTLFPPRRIGFPPVTSYEEVVDFGSYSVAPEYIQFGKETHKKYDYIFHIRNREDVRPQDNWSIKRWENLRSLLPQNSRIACIGKSKASSIIEGVDDLRDIPLKELCDIIATASFVFGPSSGPMHLSSICATPHIVWSIPSNKDRYVKNWNPLKTPVLFLGDHDWNPTAEYVYDRFVEWKKNDL